MTKKNESINLINKGKTVGDPLSATLVDEGEGFPSPFWIESYAEISPLEVEPAAKMVG
ncbi:hypothetical protein [Neobacillus drentensis]|uniref:hypothetical protein n=1 Tax=Neobacillus drentensis TaxID=220684 RepID=UPI0030004770